MSDTKMPDAIADGSFIPTLNNQGAVWLYVDKITQAYLDFVSARRGTFLEIGAGYGHTVIKALEAGAGKVLANDIDEQQLRIIKERTPAEFANKLSINLGQFPESLSIASNSLDGIYSARVLHFLEGNRIRNGLGRIYDWLRPGGQVFLVNDAIYRTIFRLLIPGYESRRTSGAEWPGYFPDVRSCIPQELHPEQFPETMNFLDPDVMTRELQASGFRVLQAAFYPYDGDFALGRLDGRELCGAIAAKEKSE